jgi:hypothetical protein
LKPRPPSREECRGIRLREATDERSEEKFGEMNTIEKLLKQIAKIE